MTQKLGDRMKAYENQAYSDRLMKYLPAVARLDGKAFHTFCRGLEKPFDGNLTALMQETTKYLVKLTNACIGYTQSDEITLIWHTTDRDAQIYFDGRVNKIVSVLASQCSVYFNEKLAEYLPEKYITVSASGNYPVFDCRVWNVPTEMEAVNVLKWREMDAIRNSKQAVGQANFSHKELHGKNVDEIVELLKGRGINWDEYADCFKRGTFIQRRDVVRPFTVDEIDKLPAQHEARTNPSFVVNRRVYDQVRLPPLSKIINPVLVVFKGNQAEI